MNDVQAGIGYTADMCRFHRGVRAIIGSPNLWAAIVATAGLLRNRTGVAIDVRSQTETLAAAFLMPSHFNGTPTGMRRA